MGISKGLENSVCPVRKAGAQHYPARYPQYRSQHLSCHGRVQVCQWHQDYPAGHCLPHQRHSPCIYRNQSCNKGRRHERGAGTGKALSSRLPGASCRAAGLCHNPHLKVLLQWHLEHFRKAAFQLEGRGRRKF
ncbi:MAG: hypothetical protein BWX72_00104 [Firmicutes bacterium ADurb.Bin080]|nr:MAG: hypothetical protein BWX72_00104 [Firmicutes bacterium ADurb.Bin080]